MSTMKASVLIKSSWFSYSVGPSGLEPMSVEPLEECRPADVFREKHGQSAASKLIRSLLCLQFSDKFSSKLKRDGVREIA
ncbi:unnamed protein product [Linum tenue]|uniref:Uncharacterized protein n=1 Tax=Linum tenue TaxID=586396 RepID=A0AAV0KVG7_9ROSI|nr:unnamed protein product [Linum tenue]